MTLNYESNIRSESYSLQKLGIHLLCIIMENWAQRVFSLIGQNISYIIQVKMEHMYFKSIVIIIQHDDKYSILIFNLIRNKLKEGSISRDLHKYNVFFAMIIQCLNRACCLSCIPNKNSSSDCNISLLNLVCHHLRNSFKNNTFHCLSLLFFPALH